MPEAPGGTTHFPAFFVGAAVVFEDVLLAPAVQEGDHVERHFVF